MSQSHNSRGPSLPLSHLLLREPASRLASGASCCDPAKNATSACSPPDVGMAGTAAFEQDKVQVTPIACPGKPAQVKSAGTQVHTSSPSQAPGSSAPLSPTLRGKLASPFCLNSSPGGKHSPGDNSGSSPGKMLFLTAWPAPAAHSALPCPPLAKYSPFRSSQCHCA